jgi:hypothetical protein
MLWITIPKPGTFVQSPRGLSLRVIFFVFGEAAGLRKGRGIGKKPLIL